MMLLAVPDAVGLSPAQVVTLAYAVASLTAGLIAILFAAGVLPRAKTPEATFGIREFRRRWSWLLWTTAVLGIGFGLYKLTRLGPGAERDTGLINAIAEGCVQGLVIGAITYQPLVWFYGSRFAAPPTTPEIVFQQAMFTMLISVGLFYFFSEEEPGLAAHELPLGITWAGMAGLVSMTIKRRRQWEHGLPGLTEMRRP